MRLSRRELPPVRFDAYRPRGHVMASPFTAGEDCVVEGGEGEVVLRAGWSGMILLDDAGNPYPMDHQEFSDRYLPA